MAKFKKGDKVRRNNSNTFDGVAQGDEVIVARVKLGHFTVGESGYALHCPRNYELVEVEDKPQPVHPYDAVIRAWLDGKAIQVLIANKWHDCQSLQERVNECWGLIDFSTTYQYRIKPEPTENELRKEAILKEMDDLKAELEQLEVK